MRFGWTGLILAPLLVPVAGDVQRAAEFLARGPAGAVVSITAGSRLHRVIRHHDIPLPALPVSILFVAANDKSQGLPAGTGAGRGGCSYR